MTLLTSRIKFTDVSLVNVFDIFISKVRGKKYDDVRQHILRGVLKQFEKKNDETERIVVNFQVFDKCVLFGFMMFET